MSEILWGAEAIGKAIGRTRAQTYHLLAAGHIKCAKKVGDTWVVSRGAVLRELGGDATYMQHTTDFSNEINGARESCCPHIKTDISLYGSTA